MCVRAKRENGWHDLQRRLLDAGRTDYASYAFYEKEMTPVPGQKDCFNYKGRSVIANPDGCIGAQSTELFVFRPFFFNHELLCQGTAACGHESPEPTETH